MVVAVVTGRLDETEDEMGDCAEAEAASAATDARTWVNLIVMESWGVVKTSEGDLSWRDRRRCMIDE